MFSHPCDSSRKSEATAEGGDPLANNILSKRIDSRLPPARKSFGETSRGSDKLRSSSEAIAHNKSGFTLIEISIVLVIIGLLIGGVLVGQDLIEAASIRSQLTQIEKINLATNTFELKYDNLPADIQTPAQYGLYATSYCDAGGGHVSRCHNGYIDGGAANTISAWLFFRHLRDAGLMECEGCAPDLYDWTGATYDQMFPIAKLGSNYRMLVYGGPYPGSDATATDFSKNYIEISSLATSATTQVTPSRSYAMDAKVDDGLPLTGRVTAKTHNFMWANGFYWYTPQLTPSSGAAGSTACVSTSSTPNVYNTTSDSTSCGIRFEAQF